MSNTIRILGIDPSMRNTGMAVVDYNLSTGHLDLVHLTIAQTEKTDEKTVRRASDDLARAKVLVASLQRTCKEFGPTVAMAEIPVGAQSARAAFSNGLCCGVLASVPVPIIEVTPSEVKLAACGSKTASKDEMIAWAVAKWPNAKWMTRKLKGEVKLLNDNEHLADACAAVNAGILTPQFAQAAAMASALRAA